MSVDEVFDEIHERFDGSPLILVICIIISILICTAATLICLVICHWCCNLFCFCLRGRGKRRRKTSKSQATKPGLNKGDNDANNALITRRPQSPMAQIDPKECTFTLLLKQSIICPYYISK